MFELVMEFILEIVYSVVSRTKKETSDFFDRIPKRWDRLDEDQKQKLETMRENKKQKIESRLAGK